MTQSVMTFLVGAIGCHFCKEEVTCFHIHITWPTLAGMLFFSDGICACINFLNLFEVEISPVVVDRKCYHQ